MFGKYNGFVSKAGVSACMYFLVNELYSLLLIPDFVWRTVYNLLYIQRDKLFQVECLAVLTYHVNMNSQRSMSLCQKPTTRIRNTQLQKPEGKFSNI